MTRVGMILYDMDAPCPTGQERPQLEVLVFESEKFATSPEFAEELALTLREAGFRTVTPDAG